MGTSALSTRWRAEAAAPTRCARTHATDNPAVIGLGSYLAFLGVSLLVICTPGQDTALTIRNTLLGSRATGVATAVGVSTGQAAWTVATSAGLSVVVMASGSPVPAVRLA